MILMKMNKLNHKIAILMASAALITSGGCKKSFLDSDQLSQYSPEA
jgi:starch-binding outer membrane protein, SusD/RagB family